MAKKENPSTVLIPLVSRQEDNPDFLNTVTQDFARVVLLVVVDQHELVGRFGFVATEIRTATALLETIKAFLETQNKTVEDIMEWGDTGRKTAQVAELWNCQKIVLVKQENEYFKKLVKELEQNTQTKLEIIPVAGLQAKPETQK